MYRIKQKKGKKKERSLNFSQFSCPSQCSASLYNITVLSNPAHLRVEFLFYHQIGIRTGGSEAEEKRSVNGFRRRGRVGALRRSESRP